MEQRKRNAILDVYCASCGAPAEFDIANQTYNCRFCGAKTGVRAALEAKKHFRSLHREQREQRPTSRLFEAHCCGCGAKVVFPEGEALSKCAFCGKSLVRKEYLKTDEFPEVLIPFRLTPAQAKARLLAWCDANRGRREAKAVRAHADELEGFYLPYQLIKGPTTCAVRRDDTRRAYECRGFVDGMFVNTSVRLNNRVLNGTEPYDLSDLRDFDFGYLAGQRVRIADLTGSEEADRVRWEIRNEYEPFIDRTMESRAVSIKPDTGGLLSMSAVLPAYYLRAGLVRAAVNGQTGKVAVEEQKKRFLPPWWLKPIAATLLLIGIVFLSFWLPTRDWMLTAFLTGILGLFFTTVVFTAYHNEYAGTPRWQLENRILTSDGASRTGLPPPVFYETLDGTPTPVRLKFTSLYRTLRMVAFTLLAMFLPYLIAFVLNGFSPAGLQLGGSAVWLCITVPVAPIYLIKLGRMELYERPLIYVEKAPGRWRRRRRKFDLKTAAKRVKDNFSFGKLGIALAVLAFLALQVFLTLHWNEI